MGFTPDVQWTGNFKEIPTPIGARSGGDDNFRDTKVAFRERFQREHEMELGTDNDLHGIHKVGSGVVETGPSGPTRNYAGESIPASGLESYLRLDRDPFIEDRQFVGEYTSASAWNALTPAVPSDAFDAIPTANYLVDTSANVGFSTMINWVRGRVGGDFHGHIPAVGVVAEIPISGIEYVTTGYIQFSFVGESVEYAKSEASGAPAAIILMGLG